MPDFPSDSDLIDAGTRITRLFTLAGRPVSPDWCSSVWIARYAWDRMLGVSHQVSLAKHEAELRAALGLAGDRPPPVTGDVIPQALRREGRELKRADGSLWRWAGISSFLLLKQVVNNEDVSLALQEAISLGANHVRVLGAVSWGGTIFLSPKGNNRYYSALANLFDECAAAGLYCHFVALASTSAYQGLPGTLPILADQQAHWARVAEVCAGRTNVILDLVNEYDHPAQAVDPTKFSRPAIGCLCSRGSATADRDPATPVWDLELFHTARDQEWMRKLKAAREYSDRDNRPCAVDEPMGANETAQPGRRDNNPDHFFDAGAVAGLLTTGATFHSEAGLTSSPLGPIQRQCAEAFFLGLHATPVEARTWTYSRGGLSGFCLEHKDLPDPAGSLRTFGMIAEREAWSVAVAPALRWMAKPTGDWQIVDQLGRSGHVVHLRR
jgi:hypothetical protein